MARGTDPSDDVFAFGTVLFETFAGKVPFANESNEDNDVATRILSGRLPDAIQELDLTAVIKIIGAILALPLDLILETNLPG